MKGTVTLDGDPVPKGEIIFAVAGKTPVTLTITDGQFSGDVVPGKNKVTFGVYREVKVRPMPDLPEEISKENILPPRYFADSKIEEDIPEEGKTDLSYALKKK